MARRKPTQVQRNRQQNQRVREIEAALHDTADTAGESVSESAVEVIEIDDSGEENDHPGLVEDEPRAFKRQRTLGFQWRRRGLMHEEVVLVANARSKMYRGNAPWDDSKRGDSLWLTIGVDTQSPLGEKLRTMAKNDRLAHVQCIGFRLVDSEESLASPSRKMKEKKEEANHESEEHAMEDDASEADGGLVMQELCGDCGSAFEAVVRCDFVTMELQRTSATTATNLGFGWRVGVDWTAYNMACEASNYASNSTPRQTRLAASMQQFMVWLLHHHTTGRDAFGETAASLWQYPYPQEFHALFDSTGNQHTAFDIHDVYAKIDVQRQLQRDVSILPASVTSSGGGVLLPSLRDYQKAALSWMLSREGVGNTTTQTHHQLTRSVRFSLANGDVLLYDLFCGRFNVATGDLAVDEPLVTDLSAVRGGILADEMGLGKTVEVIALVLSNPAPQAAPVVLLESPSQSDHAVDHASFEKNCICGTTDDCAPGWVQCDLCNLWHHQLCTGYNPERAEKNQGVFICFQCQVEQHVVVSCKTTLIVSPESIHDQWESELKRHVKPGVLTLLRYPGVKALRLKLDGKGPSAEWQVLASCSTHMASHDIVLTTYEALGSDLHHVPTALGKARRSSTRQKRKKYAFHASPLVFLHFWRVCMDEAQVGVENTQLRAALTVAQLRSEMQWIVTGTPFSTQLMDLYGCFKFLRVAPFCDDDAGGRRHFQTQIETCFLNGAVGRVLDVLLSERPGSRSGGGLLWRTSKKDVLSQLELPTQTQEIVWCRFSDVERLFYSQRETEVVQALKDEQQRRRREQDRDVAKDDVGDAVWHRLLMLRQVCCHPQVGQILHSIGASVRSGAGRRGRGLNGRGGGGGGGGGGGMHAGAMAVLTMDDFLQQLLDKCRRECEEAQRKLVAALNGHASLALIHDDGATAILKYMVSVELIRNNWHDFRADLLPRLHILDNLASCVRRAFQLGAATHETRATVVLALESDETSSRNPKQVSLMPELAELRRAITPNGLCPETVDREAVRRDCADLESAADTIRRFYLFEIESRHTTARLRFETLSNTTTAKLCKAQTGRDRREAMLCSSDLWWLEMLGLLRQRATVADPHASVASMVDRLRGHLFASGTNWATSFADRFHDVHGLTLALVDELVELSTKRRAITAKLLQRSQPTPTKTDIEMSGNCKKCRDARDGPICWHCRFYKELEGYKQHLLGIDSTLAPVASSALASWAAAGLLEEDEDDAQRGDPALASAATTTASRSLLVDIFRQLAAGTRVLLRENRMAWHSGETEQWLSTIQNGLQQETEVWAQLLSEWNRATKLFQAQHQRLGALDELEMAQMKIRLRLPGELVVTATDKLYKLQLHELPLKSMELDSDRVAAEEELKAKQSELRYLRHLQETSESVASAATATMAAEVGVDERDEHVCVVCFEKITTQRVAMLPCAHKTCVPCADRMAHRNTASHSIRCPTCRRVFPSDARTHVVNDAGRAKELSLAARTRPIARDAHVALQHSGFSSKIDAILRRVRALAITNPALKALVFTQWQSMMGVIAAALQLNGVQCFTYTSKKTFPSVLQQFKQFSSACVLALPFSVGANGLNIVEATEVLLVEPLLNTSMEAQAINRVHRIGQTKATRVHRFVVDESVEEGIYWLGQKTTRRPPRVDMEEEEEKDVEMEDGGGTKGDDSLVVGRQEKEQVTIGQLEALLQGRAIHDSGIDGDGDHPFWQQRVAVNGREMTRREARELLERRRAAEQRQKAATATPHEPVTLLVDRDVHLMVAHELLQMSECSSGNDELGSPATRRDGLTELVHMARLRVSEEVRLWRASRAVSSL